MLLRYKQIIDSLLLYPSFHKSYQKSLYNITYFTDTPVFEFLASGKASEINLVLGGLSSPRRVLTLDNVDISHLKRCFRHNKQTQ